VVSRSEPPKNRITRDDLLGALASFWLVFLSTIPAVVPFLIFRDQPRFALRVSNGLLLGLLFLVGYQWAKFTGSRRLLTGFVMMLLGAVLVAMAIALGG
jgi:VIT1/CCC1 family predicted Fe2+/Mn2+ transporter